MDRRDFITTLGLSAGACALPRRDFAQLAAGPDLAHDPCRPEYHFVAPHNWINDPNGPIWWKGNYHLFYQLNPNAAVWGDMHWGHAVSKDMVHWKHQPIALAPTPDGPDRDGCYSGSAVVCDGVPTIIYTGIQKASPEMAAFHDERSKRRERQLLATAEDDGLVRWKKLNTPIIERLPAGMDLTGFRDPCPWREGDGWYLGVGSGELHKGGCVLLYRSTDLRHWEYLNPLAEGKPNGVVSDSPLKRGEMWECPDFFEVDGQRCLLYSTAGQCFWNTGEYDRHEHRFAIKRQGVLDHGAYYAPKSFLAPDGRRILWGWVRETRPAAEYSRAGWAGMMSLPRVLHIDEQGQLHFGVAAEVEALRGPAERFRVKAGAPLRRPLPGLRQELALAAGRETGVVTVRIVSGGSPAWELKLDGQNMTAVCGEKSIPLPAGKLSLRLFLDGSVVESFIGSGEALTSRVYTLEPGKTEIEVNVSGKAVLDATLWTLAAISADRLTT